jgi:predicted DCC family thiol-disulfide oxidoreductase YuxK
VARGPLRTFTVFAFILMHWSFHLFLLVGIFSYVMTVAWVVLLPGWFWDRVEARMRWSRTACQICYDKECGFCLRAVQILSTFLLLRNATIRPAQDAADIFAQMTEAHSWVVIDADGNSHTRYDALLALLAASPCARFVVPLLRLGFFRWIGESAYGWVSTHRPLLARATRSVRPRPVTFAVSRMNQLLCGFFLIYVLLWNLRIVYPQTFGRVLSPSAQRMAVLLGLDQYWGMFSPHPAKDDGWYVVDAQLEAGSHIDLFRDGQKVSFDKPEAVAALFTSEAWRKYFNNLSNPAYHRHREYYADYVCRLANRERKGRHRVAVLEVMYMLEHTEPTREGLPQPVSLLNWSCSDRPSASPW